MARTSLGELFNALPRDLTRRIIGCLNPLDHYILMLARHPLRVVDVGNTADTLLDTVARYGSVDQLEWLLATAGTRIVHVSDATIAFLIRRFPREYALGVIGQHGRGETLNRALVEVFENPSAHALCDAVFVVAITKMSAYDRSTWFATLTTLIRHDDAVALQRAFASIGGGTRYWYDVAAKFGSCKVFDMLCEDDGNLHRPLWCDTLVTAIGRNQGAFVKHVCVQYNDAVMQPDVLPSVVDMAVGMASLAFMTENVIPFVPPALLETIVEYLDQFVD